MMVDKALNYTEMIDRLSSLLGDERSGIFDREDDRSADELQAIFVQEQSKIASVLLSPIVADPEEEAHRARAASALNLMAEEYATTIGECVSELNVGRLFGVLVCVRTDVAVAQIVGDEEALDGMNYVYEEGLKRYGRLTARARELRRRYIDSLTQRIREHHEATKKWNCPAYDQYRDTPEWEDLKRDKLEEADHRCEATLTVGSTCYRCPSKQNLEIHHETYERLGRERNTDLKVLCARHHAELHGQFIGQQ